MLLLTILFIIAATRMVFNHDVTNLSKYLISDSKDQWKKKPFGLFEFDSASNSCRRTVHFIPPGGVAQMEGTSIIFRRGMIGLK